MRELDGLLAPRRVTDPVVIEDITAWYAEQVYRARLMAEAMLLGLEDPPAPSRHARTLLRVVRLRSGRRSRTRRLHLLAHPV
jgi:hypothetical protein